MTRALLAHHGQNGAGDVHRADEVGGELSLDVFRRQLFKVARKEVARIVDQYVDAAKPVDGG